MNKCLITVWCICFDASLQSYFFPRFLVKKIRRKKFTWRLKRDRHSYQGSNLTIIPFYSTMEKVYPCKTLYDSSIDRLVCCSIDISRRMQVWLTIFFSISVLYRQKVVFLAHFSRWCFSIFHLAQEALYHNVLIVAIEKWKQFWKFVLLYLFSSNDSKVSSQTTFLSQKKRRSIKKCHSYSLVS